jgi:hypothetical protein
MTDIVEIAKERQARAVTEIAELDDFIQMAETLMEGHENNAEEKGNNTAFILV